MSFVVGERAAGAGGPRAPRQEEQQFRGGGVERSSGEPGEHLECSREAGRLRGSCHSTREVVWGTDPPKVLSRKRYGQICFLERATYGQVSIQTCLSKGSLDPKELFNLSGR